MVVDAYLVYSFIRRLVTPFEKYPAFKAGLIDKDGNFTKSRNMFTPDERKVLPLFDIMIINLKRLIAKFPLGKTRLATIAAALLLLRSKPTAKKVHEDYTDELFTLEEDLIRTMAEVKSVMEDGAVGAANSVGAGGISGLGSPPDVIVVPKKAAQKYKKKNKADIIMGIIKRKPVNV
jgi:hypothetical protein